MASTRPSRTATLDSVLCIGSSTAIRSPAGGIHQKRWKGKGARVLLRGVRPEQTQGGRRYPPPGVQKIFRLKIGVKK